MTSEGVSDWGTPSYILELAQIGDLIEINRSGTGYTHWVVYIGDGLAIHVYLPSKLAATATIQKELLVGICNGDKCRINNLLPLARSKGLEARKPQEIVEAAEECVGQTVEYRLLSDNCEFFSTACRYGEAFCGQVERPSNTLIGFGTAAVAMGVSAIAAGLFLKMPANRNRNQRK